MASAFSGSFSSIGGLAAERTKMSAYDEYPIMTVVMTSAIRLRIGRPFFWVHQTPPTSTATSAIMNSVGAPDAPASVGRIWTMPG